MWGLYPSSKYWNSKDIMLFDSLEKAKEQLDESKYNLVYNEDNCVWQYMDDDRVAYNVSKII